jgi:hypothetical protein
VVTAAYKYQVAIPEDLDLNALLRQLATHFRGAAPVGYVRGKGALRAAVVHKLGCSELEAEQLVDTLEGLGLISYEGDRADEVDDLENRWRFVDRQPT